MSLYEVQEIKKGLEAIAAAIAALAEAVKYNADYGNGGRKRK